MSEFIQLLSDNSENIYFVEGERNGRYPYSNSLLIEDCLIDTGISSRHLRKLKRKFSIKKVLFTHWHEDHISGHRILKDVEMHCHINDKPLIENFKDLYKKYYCMINTPVENLFDDIFETMRLEKAKIHQILEHNQIININNNSKIQVIHTPGHSAGHCCFLELNSKICFLGDIDFSSFGPWYAGLDSNLSDFEESILRLKQYDINTAITSHKGIFSGSKLIKEELDKFKSFFDIRDQKILSHFSEKKAKNVNELIKQNIIYKFYGEFKEYDVLAEKIMIKMHIDKLLKNKLIEQQKDGYILK
ncbi:MAG: MBL fold metallo-hydrolase [Candidatus Hermodarchaeota archaeon]